MGKRWSRIALRTIVAAALSTVVISCADATSGSARLSTIGRPAGLPASDVSAPTGCSSTFVGPGTDWDDPNAWMPAGVPGVASLVCIPDGQLVILSNLSGPRVVTIASLRVGPSSTALGATLQVIGHDLTLQVAGDVLVELNAGAYFTGDTQGTLVLASQTLSIGGYLRVQQACATSCSASTLRTSVAVTAGGTLETTGAVNFDGDLVNTGQVLLNGTPTFELPKATFDNRGALRVSGGPLQFTQGTTFISTQGSSVVSGDVELHGAKAQLSGTVGGLSVLDSSELVVGTVVGTLNVLGNFIQDGSSTTHLDIVPVDPTTVNADLLVVTGNQTSIDGVVNLVTSPMVIGGICGQEMNLIIAATPIAGAFSAQGTALAADRSWRVVTDVRLVTILGGNPIAPIDVGPTTVAAAEGAQWSNYNLCVSRKPTDIVYVDITPDAQTRASITYPLQFSDQNWWRPQQLGVVAVNDLIVEGDHVGYVQHAARSADPYFNGASATLTVKITDDDPTADLALTTEPLFSDVKLNHPFTMPLTVTNNGPAPSSGSEVVLPASPAFRFLGVSGTTCALSAGAMRCVVAPLAVGQVFTFRVTILPIVYGPTPVVISVVGQETDSDPRNSKIKRFVYVHAPG